MRAMLSIAPAFFHAKIAEKVVRPGGLELPTFWFVAGFSYLLPDLTQIHRALLAL